MSSVGTMRPNKPMSQELGKRKVNPFTQEIKKDLKVGPEQSPWFWNPNRVEVKFAPAEFLKKLKQLGEELSCTWNPILERWQLWAQSPTVQQKICHGWRLLFIVNEPDGSYAPLDERVFARLYHASVLSHGSGKEYFARVMQEMERDQQKREEKSTQDSIDAAMPSFQHGQISISMCGKSNGSKFSDYHA
jgi:hypothetical protein